jgi:acetyl-CoA carboxylase biotin carboxyl carrier protein
MKRKKSSKSNSAFANPEIQQIEQLLQFMTEHNLEEFEYSRGDLRIRLRKPSATVVVGAPRGRAATEIIETVSVETSASSSGAAAAAEAHSAEDLHLVKSPIVGTFYAAPSPGADPFVKIGARVESGQTLCIVEAMKLMNEIEADVTGELVKVFVETGQPVEYGQPLFGIRPSGKK